MALKGRWLTCLEERDLGEEALGSPKEKVHQICACAECVRMCVCVCVCVCVHGRCECVPCMR
jgi:hypothetical protein